MTASHILTTAALVLTAIAFAMPSELIGSVSTPVYAQANPGNATPKNDAPGTAAKNATKRNEVFTDALGVSAVALVKLFVLALILESGLAVLFHWKPYLVFFNGRGMNALIAVVVAWALVKQFEVDTVSQLVEAYTGKPPANKEIAEFITALVLAGGSSGIHRILTALGFRLTTAEIEATDKPINNSAWVAVSFNRRNAVGPIFVAVMPQSGTPSSTLLRISGSVDRRSFGRRLRDCFLRDFNRFPQSGGYVVTPGQPYVIEIVAHDSKNNKIVNPLAETYVFADRAIVDFEVVL